jgi:hypothetical protein
VGEVLDVARSSLEEIRRQWGVLPYRYGFESRIGGREDLRSGGSGGASGFRIEGRIHSIKAGLGLCYLEEMEWSPGERGRVVRRIDVRDRTRVETDDWGSIKITRRKLQLTLPEQLAGLIAFLIGIPDAAEVRVLRTDGTTSVMELVRMAAEDADEGAEEELFERGEVAKRELIAKLRDRKARRYHGTIAWVLLTVFPSAESREAVGRAAEREEDPARKKELLGLLAVTAESGKSA